MTLEKNVLGGLLQPHCHSPKTGFYRDGYCRTGQSDKGLHVIASVVTQEFLEFTRSRGNDLQTPLPAHSFFGLKSGDRWCLCALRWRDAHEAGLAPPVVLEATHEKALRYIPFEILDKYRVR